ncbi:TPA: hypothetical protein ACLNNW_003634, partial [Vibrio cholerae O1]
MFICSSAVLAEDYYWTLDWDQKRYGSFSEACSVFSAAMIKNNPQGGLTLSVLKVNATSVACQMKNPQGGIPYTASVIRSGGGCTAPKTYNQATGACDSPPEPPEPCTGSDIFRGPDGPISVAPDGTRRVTTRLESACKNSCEYLITKTARCFQTPGLDGVGFCNYIGNASGASCVGESAPGSTGPDLNPPAPNEPPEDPNDPGCNGMPGYVWSGTSCVKPDGPDNPDPGGDGGDGEGGNGSGGNGGGGNGSGGDGSGGGSGGDNGGNGGNGSGSGGTGSGTGTGTGTGTGSGGGTGGGNGSGSGGGTG